MPRPIEAAALNRLLGEAGIGPDTKNADLIRELVVTALRLGRQQTPRGDLKIMNTAMKELRHAFGILGPHRGTRKVTVFGSARTAPDSADYQAAREFSAKMAQRGFMTITGGAGGIMAAGNEGAGRERTFAFNIRLPWEQGANEFIEGDEKLLWFKYFFTRKLVFVKESDAIALFPGGYGTQDEGFETLTLSQTGKNHPMPIVLVDRPGGGYWKGWERFVREQIVGNGLASPEDVALYRIVDDVDAAVEEVAGFFRNYHSSRFVGDRFVIRLNRPIPRAGVEALAAEFEDIVVDGTIDVSATLPNEEDDPAIRDLPRLVFAFDRRHFARLRQLIDRLNALY